MGFLKKIKKLVQMTDFFNSTQMLRYENQNQYRTFTGGIFSLGIIITIIIGFASMILDTLNLSSITYTQDIITYQDPKSSIMTTSPDSNFMFGIEIWRQNLSSPIRYFDVLPFIYVQNAGINSPVKLELVQCTKEHWASMPDVVANFDKLQMSGWLCPPIGAQYELVGKYTSDYYKQIVFNVAPCNNATDPSRPCASPQQIQQLFADNGDWFYFTYYYINTIINPDQPNYKNYYLEDTAYVTFGQQLGIESYLYFSDFEITTDYSIWPFSNIQEDDGVMTQNLPTSHPYSITASNNANYVSFAMAKSPKSLVYARQVQKISNVFSFMGGLIGALMAGLFVINSYTSFAYEISIALSVFKREKSDLQLPQPQMQNSRMVNFVHFIKYYWFIFQKYLKKDYKDDNIEHIYECRREILRQLDIKSLIKRIIFLEYAMTFIFTDYQLQGLQIKKPTDPLDVKVVRKRIQNIDMADMESSFNGSQLKDKQLNDLLQPKSAFNLETFLKSSRVANLHTDNNEQNGGRNDIQADKHCRQVIFVQNISENSNQEFYNAPRTAHQKKKTERLNHLIQSAKEGNELSKRIWNSIRAFDETAD